MWAITYSDALSSFPVMLPVYSSKSSSAYAAGLYKPRLPSNDNVIAAVRNRFPDFHFEHSFIICSSIFLFFRNMKYIPRFPAAGYYTAAGTVTILAALPHYFRTAFLRTRTGNRHSAATPVSSPRQILLSHLYKYGLQVTDYMCRLPLIPPRYPLNHNWFP